jgi:hypothetical protein
VTIKVSPAQFPLGDKHGVETSTVDQYAPLCWPGRSYRLFASFIVSVPTALKESRLDALAKGTAFLLIRLVELASMNIVVTMAEDLRAIRERLDG